MVCRLLRGLALIRAKIAPRLMLSRHDGDADDYSHLKYLNDIMAPR